MFNVSERPYEKARFDGRVSSHGWNDHTAPPFHLLLKLVEEMYKFLCKDPENVVVIHCNSGKGRAGTSCTCLLLFSGFYDNILDCAKHFGARRFTDKKGISQPCQVRFIHYFEAFYKNIVKSPQVKVLQKIMLFGIPNTSAPLKANGSKIYFEIYRVGENFRHDLLYTNKDNKEQVRFRYSEEGMVTFEIDE